MKSDPRARYHTLDRPDGFLEAEFLMAYMRGWSDYIRHHEDYGDLETYTAAAAALQRHINPGIIEPQARERARPFIEGYEDAMRAHLTDGTIPGPLRSWADAIDIGGPRGFNGDRYEEPPPMSRRQRREART